MKEIMTQPEKVEYILNRGCAYLGLDKDKLDYRGGNKSKDWHKKRFLIVLLLDNTNSSLREVAAYVGYKSHQNIMYHYKNMKQELSSELYGSDKIKSIYNELLSYLNLTNYGNYEGTQTEKTVG
jgi:chromosomal replication initiation ATPase DnaA